MDAIIYSLSDPRNGEIRYVGKTIDLNLRLKCHLCEPPRNHKNYWIRSLLKLGLKPSPTGRKGIPLSEEHKAKLRAANLGRVPWHKGGKLSDSHKLALSKSKLGIKKSPEHILKLSASKKGIPLSAEHRRAISCANTGRRHSEAAKLRISKSHFGIRPCVATRIKMSNSAKGRIPWNKGLKLA